MNDKKQVIKRIDLTIKKETGRLDKVLAHLLTDYSRSQIQQWIEEGLVQVNEQIVKKNKRRIEAGDQIVIDIPAPEEVSLVAEDISLDILYEDQDLAVINKPSGLVVHPAPGHPSGTLVNALMYHIKDLSGINGELRPGIVHRLDKDTSGALVVAKNDTAHRFLSAQLKDRSMKREYVALVHHAFPHDSGTIDAPISRDQQDRKKYTVDSQGKEAVTHFKVVENIGDFSLVRAKLETGRTHQIRVHFQSIKHPVYGDAMYGPKNSVADSGQYLHAYRLGFIHPQTKEYLEFEAPLPSYFQEKINQLIEQK